MESEAKVVRKGKKTISRKLRVKGKGSRWRTEMVTGVKNKKKLSEKVRSYREEKSEPKIDKEKFVKYNRGDEIDDKMVKNNIERKRLKEKEKKVNYALEQSVRTELLLTEDEGFLEGNEGKSTCHYTQSQIQEAVDPISASKRFDLILKDFGPYRMNYTNNGRYLLLGGKRGHVAALDWISKKLMCEMNVMESVYDVSWLHQETLYAVAQKKWVYFYDNQGIEIHCVKQLFNAIKLLFLPYHFLLSTVSSAGMISWLDVSVGKIVEQFKIPVHRNPATVAMHPRNAMICLGHSSGTVSFWSPNLKKPCITKWCHKQPLCSVAFDPQGETFVTSSIDRSVKLWDARNLDGPVHNFKLRSPTNWIALGRKGHMALGLGNVIEIYQDSTLHGKIDKKIYLRHTLPSFVKNMEFCPYEDILGIAHTSGFSSILVPGSGEANFDALEFNPLETKAQKREAEVQRLLTKIPSELITWDPTELRKIHIPSLEDIIEERKKLAFIKPPDIHIEPKYKTGKKSGSANAIKRKKIMKEERRKELVKATKEQKKREESNDLEKVKKKKNRGTVLDRFKPKK